MQSNSKKQSWMSGFFPVNGKINPPCIGCLKRVQLCKINCKEWAEYEKKKKEEEQIRTDKYNYPDKYIKERI